MASNTSINQEFIEAVAAEMVSGMEAVVDRWMTEFDTILQDPRLTTLGRLQAIDALVARYKHATGKSEFLKLAH